ncbi:MAG: cob(I)yrinic acid a,c-diamide adenosyltransferase [Paracoccaceae bacterium]
MVTLNKIYTKTGDEGKTSLGNGDRVNKHSLRVDAYGTVDETNATVGLARLHAKDITTTTQLSAIQNDLFDLGADLCRPNHEDDAKSTHRPLRINSKQVKRLENEIDSMNNALKTLKSFVLPGGSALAAHLHLCRTVTRRAERLTFALSEIESVNEIAVRYLNRLSDWFFVASRIANSNGADDILWVPGDNH